MSSMGMYAFAVLLALAIHGLLFLPLIYISVTRHSFKELLSNVALPLVMAFSTASSMSTAPATIAVLEERRRLDPRLVRLLVPAASVINMDGTSIYITVSTIFFAQVRTTALYVYDYFLIGLLGIVASMASEGIAAPGFIRLYLVMSALGMPAEDVSALLLTDWIL
ncbi:unnamed protein product, partial [Ixodes pacificus]